jgi:alkylation response protein AidB-like acyl-CoA dehydrogenase
MSESSHYKANLRDLHFNLFEFFKIQDGILGQGPFAQMDHDTAKATLTGLHQMCVETLASSYAEGDRVPLSLDDEGNVTLPTAVKDSLAAWYEAQWNRLEIPVELGGYGAPPSMVWASWEMVVGSHAAIAFYQFGAFIARVIDRLATPSQRDRFVSNIVEKNWGATMVLTEPDAGSDVGAGRSKARHLHDDVWELEGTKRFITNGDSDHVENIVHLVLARPEGAGPGTKGLSMFIVPKYWVEEDGSIGERNGVVATGLEKKMGLKASATCELTLGENKQCRGLLVGEVHDGIKQMFMVIEQARMCIGVKSMSHVSSAYLNALSYAQERVQGPELKNATDKTAPRVAIIRHPDVRRSLMNLKAHAEGMRALCFYSASLQDQISLAEAESAQVPEDLEKRNALLLPLVKGYCSDTGYRLLADALQIFGGSGYCEDYPIEQYIRDQKIDTLYEGTTHIQSLDLLFRKVGRDNGETLAKLLTEMKDWANQTDKNAFLAEEKQSLKRAIQDVEGIFGALMQKMGEDLNHVGLNGNRILLSLAELTIGYLLLKQAALAGQKRETAVESDRFFYEGKIASARFFSQNIFPQLTLTRKLVEKSNLDVMGLNDSLF